MAPPHRVACALLVLFVAGCAAPTPTPAVSYQGTATHSVDEHFDTFVPGSAPPGWLSLSGHWSVAANASAPTPPNVVQQTQAVPNVFNLLADAKDGTVGNLKASLKVNIQPGPAEMTAGLAFRIVDINNYYAVDYDQAEGGWSLYTFVHGQQDKIVSNVTNVPNATTGEWLSLSVEATGAHIVAYYGTTKIVDVQEYQPGAPTVGMVGLWSRDETVASYDDLHFEPTP
ncbi:MAG: hypothetical protein ACYDBQ_05455 [Thermoplasmatota archaeon]